MRRGLRAAVVTAAISGSSVPVLGFTGSLTVELGSSGPHFTLTVINNPAADSYDTFAETTDADAVSTLSTADVTISGALGAHSVTYTASSSSGNPLRPNLTLVVSVSIVDTTAPVLSLPTDVKTGVTTADIGATTDEASGTMYVVASTSSTAPSAAQIIAGQMHTGSAAAAAANSAVGATGAKAVGVTGLTEATTYYGHTVQRDASSNTSNVVSGDGFTTDSASVGTWNASDKAASVTLSNGDLDATNPATGDWAPVRAATGKSTGKFYFELKHTVAGGHANPIGGVADLTNAVLAAGEYIGSAANQLGMRSGDHLETGITVDGSSGLNPLNDGNWIGAGKIAGFAVDLDAKKLWARNDTGWLSSGDPAAGTNEFAHWAAGLTLYPACSIYFDTTADTVRYQGNASNQTYAAPTGFTAWDGA